MSDHEVIDAILAAFRDGRKRGDARLIGTSGRGFAIEPNGAVIRKCCPPSAERYSLPELRAALETWIAAIERARRSADPTTPP